MSWSFCVRGTRPSTAIVRSSSSKHARDRCQPSAVASDIHRATSTRDVSRRDAAVTKPEWRKLVPELLAPLRSLPKPPCLPDKFDPDDLDGLFSEFDVDGDGFIIWKELWGGLRAEGETLPDPNLASPDDSFTEGKPKPLSSRNSGAKSLPHLRISLTRMSSPRVSPHKKGTRSS